MRRTITILLTLATLCSVAIAASTVNPNIPPQSTPSNPSPLSSAPIRGNFAAAAADINNILGCYAKTTPPGNPVDLQSWCDTTTTPTIVFKTWNARNSVWVPYASLNINTNTYTPIASSGTYAATTPLAVNVTGGVVRYSLSIDSNFQVNGSNQLALANLQSGRVMANAGASSVEPTAGGVTGTSWFDRAYCNTVGYLLVRFVGVWTCSNSFPLDITWVGAVPNDGVDDGPAINLAITMSQNVTAPVGNFDIKSCVTGAGGVAGINFGVTSIRDVPATFSGAGGGQNIGGTKFLLDASLPDNCHGLLRAGTGNVFGTRLRDFSILPAAGFYAAGPGTNCVYVNGDGFPDYFEYNFKMEGVYCGNMKLGDSFASYSSPNVSIIAGITGTTMTVTSAGAGAIFVGSNIINTSGAIIAKVTAFGSGTGGTGTYTVTPSQTLAPGTVLISLGNNGGGALNNASIEHSVLMSVRMKNVGDSVLFFQDTVGQGELRGMPGYRWDQVPGATSVRIVGGIIASQNGHVVIDGGVFPSITGNVEMEMSNLANAQGCLIDVTGATSQVIGGLIDGNTLSQNSSIGTIYSVCVRNADSIKVVSNRLATTSATPPHLLNTAASANLSFNGNFCTTAGSTAPCAALNSSGSINSQRINFGTMGGTDTLNVLGGANFDVIRLTTSGGNYNIFSSGAGALVTPSGTTDFSVTGGTNQIVRQSGLGSALTVSTMATTINGVAINVGASGTITAAPSGTAGGSLAGTYPNPTLTAIITAGGPTGNATTVPQITWTNEGRLSTVTPVTIQLPVANGGTGCVVASGTCLDNITGFSANGLISRTGAGNFAARTITGTANEITATNGDGVSGNPTLSLPAALTLSGKTVTGGTFVSGSFSGTGTGLTGTAAGLTAGGNVTSVTCNGLAITVSGTCPEPLDFENLSLAASVSANILTVALKDGSGANPSAASPVRIGFASATSSTGSSTFNSVTGALSIDTNATGASLGSLNSTAFRFWIVAFDNSGTTVLALYNASTVATGCGPIDESAAQSSTPMSGSATAAKTYYTPNGTTVSSKSIRLLGYVEYGSSGLATAGTYASGPAIVRTFTKGMKRPCDEMQLAYGEGTGTTSSTSNAFGTGAAPAGSPVATITPKSAANLVHATWSSTIQTNNGTLAFGYCQLHRGASGSVNTAVGSVATIDTNVAGSTNSGANGQALDGPNVATAIQYTLRVRNSDNATTVFCPAGALNSNIVLREIQG